MTTPMDKAMQAINSATRRATNAEARCDALVAGVKRLVDEHEPHGRAGFYFECTLCRTPDAYDALRTLIEKGGGQS